MNAHRENWQFSQLASIGIAPTKSARISDGRGLTLRVEVGAVWITEECGGKDICLERGASYRLQRNGDAVVQALGERLALVTIEPPMAAAFVS